MTGLRAAGFAAQGSCTACERSYLTNHIDREAIMAIEKRDIVFPSGDNYCAAWLFLPDGASPSARVPGVAMAHGLGAVKEMYLEFFARNFATAGIAAVLFDYRHFGASGGEPRQRVAPHDQTEDYRSALTCLSLQREVDADRLGVWGTSFSGGHVLHVAAYDPRVKAVVSQVGAMDADAIMKATATPEQYAALEQMTVKERIRRATEGGEVYIPNTLSPGQTFAFQPDPESYEFAHKAQATVAPSWRDEVTMSSVGACLEYAPARSIDLIAPRPLLMFLAKSDSIAPPETIRAAFARAGEPKQLVEIGGTHYSPYLEAAEQTSRGAVDWFSKHLKA
jgi:uncharacterized protein